jgi:signal peptidase II
MSQHRHPPTDSDAPAGSALPPGALHSPAALASLLIVTLTGLGLDLFTKVWAFKALMYESVTSPDGTLQVQSRTYTFLPGWLHFHVTANPGAVFGLGEGNRWIFVAVSVAAIAFLVYLFATSAPHQRVYQIIVGMLMAGVLGNLYDRLLFGYVRDMIYMLPGRTWPTWLANRLPADWQWTRGPVFPWIFNVADTLLCTGVALMLVYSLVATRKSPPEREQRLKPVES